MAEDVADFFGEGYPYSAGAGFEFEFLHGIPMATLRFWPCQPADDES